MPLIGDVFKEFPGAKSCASAPSIDSRAAHSSHDFVSSLCRSPFAHRDKHSRTYPFFSCVARPVGRQEIERSPAAQQAMREEWQKLEANGVFDMAQVREWKDVRQQAKASGATVHHGSLATIVVEKNAELSVSDPSRKFKGRTVFLGDQVRDQDSQAAIFEELTSAPAAITSICLADLSSYSVCTPYTTALCLAPLRASFAMPPGSSSGSATTRPLSSTATVYFCFSQLGDS